MPSNAEFTALEQKYRNYKETTKVKLIEATKRLVTYRESQTALEAELSSWKARALSAESELQKANAQLIALKADSESKTEVDALLDEELDFSPSSSSSSSTSSSSSSEEEETPTESASSNVKEPLTTINTSRLRKLANKSSRSLSITKLSSLEHYIRQVITNLKGSSPKSLLMKVVSKMKVRSKNNPKFFKQQRQLHQFWLQGIIFQIRRQVFVRNPTDSEWQYYLEYYVEDYVEILTALVRDNSTSAIDPSVLSRSMQLIHVTLLHEIIFTADICSKQVALPITTSEDTIDSANLKRYRVALCSFFTRFFKRFNLLSQVRVAVWDILKRNRGLDEVYEITNRWSAAVLSTTTDDNDGCLLARTTRVIISVLDTDHRIYKAGSDGSSDLPILCAKIKAQLKTDDQSQQFETAVVCLRMVVDVLGRWENDGMEDRCLQQIYYTGIRNPELYDHVSSSSFLPVSKDLREEYHSVLVTMILKDHTKSLEKQVQAANALCNTARPTKSKEVLEWFQSVQQHRNSVPMSLVRRIRSLVKR